MLFNNFWYNCSLADTSMSLSAALRARLMQTSSFQTKSNQTSQTKPPPPAVFLTLTLTLILTLIKTTNN